MKITSSFKIVPVLLAAVCLASCTPPKNQADDQHSTPLTTSQLVDSLRYFRHNALQTDILSRNITSLGREQAFDIQLAMLDKEINDGATLIGWKMGGTATSDSFQFDPVFGYILDRNLIGEDSLVNSKYFPGGSVVVEGEIGFVLKDDLKDGVTSIEALMSHIDYVVGAVELGKSTAIPADTSALGLNYVIAAGLGQVGTIMGSTKVPAQDFDFEKETVKCYINDTLAAGGVASNIFGNPLNALFRLANLLPSQGRYLRAGDLVITGSLYTNPSIEGPAEVRLAFSTLGEITFKNE